MVSNSVSPLPRPEVRFQGPVPSLKAAMITGKYDTQFQAPAACPKATVFLLPVWVFYRDRQQRGFELGFPSSRLIFRHCFPVVESSVVH